VERCGRHVLTIEALKKAFGENVLYRGLDLGIERGERVAVIGANGAGKTTLLRIVAGELGADGGEVRMGHNVAPAYYAQHQTESLNVRKSILEEVWSAVPGDPISKVRGVCGAFLFSGDDVDKPVEVLSGGEKARVALAKVLVSKANFLVMDEPTNHLDLESTEVLIDAMQDYGGTVLFVSHNQAFVNRLATKIWDVRDGSVEEYPGSLYEYYDFLERRKAGSGGPAGAAAPDGRVAKKAAPAAAVDDGLSAKEARRHRAQTRQERKAKLKPLERRVADLEKRISKLETREAELSEQLADPELYNDKDRSVPLLKEHGEVRSKLEELMGRWEHAQEELDSVRAALDA
jgi:ATP-binding cassette subfamily F protein 3